MRLVRLGKGFQKQLPIALHPLVVRVRLHGGGGERASARLYRPPLASTPRVEGLVATRALVAHVVTWITAPRSQRSARPPPADAPASHPLRLHHRLDRPRIGCRLLAALQ